MRHPRSDLHCRPAALRINAAGADPVSHRLVEGTAELQDIPALSRKVGNYPKDVLALDATTRRELGEEYLKRASVQRRTDKPFFIDKLPNNWMYVPFIHLILPNAKIIDARRHPLCVLLFELPPALRAWTRLYLRP